MKREILLHHECIAVGAKNGLAGLYELAQHQHLQKAIQSGVDVIELNHSDNPTSSTGFYFNPAAGEGGVITATAGASHEEDGLEGVRFLFNPDEETAARLAVLAELVTMEKQSMSSLTVV